MSYLYRHNPGKPEKAKYRNPSQGPRNIYKWILYNYPGLWAITTHRQQSASFQDEYNPFTDEKL